MFGEPGCEEFFESFLFRLYTIFIESIKGLPDRDSFLLLMIFIYLGNNQAWMAERSLGEKNPVT